jgi:hypothetical protein
VELEVFVFFRQRVEFVWAGEDAFVAAEDTVADFVFVFSRDVLRLFVG